MGSSPSFFVNKILSTSATNANDFYLAGKTKILTDGTKTKTFSSEVGFIMKAITTNQDENCFDFTSGNSFKLPSSSTTSLVTLTLSFNPGGGSFISPPLPSLSASSYNNLGSRSTASTAHQIWCTKSPYLTMNSAGL